MMDAAVTGTAPSPKADSTQRWLRATAIGNLVAQGAIIVTGAVVRLTGSGLGCPTWPQCVQGSYIPTARQAQAWHKDVEFGNRLLTFVLVVIAFALAGLVMAQVLSTKRAGRPVRVAIVWLALVPIMGIVAQAVLGGITVLTHLNPAFVSAHFLLSMLLVALAVALVVRLSDIGDSPVTLIVDRRIRAYAWFVVAVTGLVVLMGVVTTGSGPHSGDANAELRYPFDPRVVAWFHADLVWAFLGLTIGLLVVAIVTNAPSVLRGRIALVLLVATCQAALGYAQYFTGLPVAMVTLHVTGAVCLWIAVLFIPPAARARR